MPGTHEEYMALATATEVPDEIVWQDGTHATWREREDVRGLQEYTRRYLRNRRWRMGEPQRRAMQLLRSLISPAQREQLRKSRYFLVTGTNGGYYRLDPYHGNTHEVTRHGDRWFVRRRFCLHDDQAEFSAMMPPADLSVAHMLLLRSDEAEFLKLANAYDARDLLWNGDYARRIREARRERELEPTHA